MKKSILVIFTLLVSSVVMAGQDVTNRYLSSAGFEAGGGAWTTADMKAQTNTSFALKEGAVYMEKWTGKGGSVGNASVRQLVELPCGVYRLTASAQNVQEGSPDAMQSGASVFAGGSSVAVGPAGDYSVTFTHVDRTIEVGFEAKQARGNWVTCDNFRLELVDDSVCHLRDVIEELLQSASTLQDDSAEGQRLAECANEVKNALSTQTVASEGLAAALDAFNRALLLRRVAGAASATPYVVTDSRYARGSDIAFGRSTVSGVSASNLLEQGFCWSADGEPTVADHRCTAYITNSGRIYKITGLEPGHRYYMRAYAMTKDYAVGYGDVLTIYTLPKARITYSYDDGADAAANTRIWNALKVSMDAYWGHLTSINGLNLSVHYGSGTQTADCSYGGWMRIGPSSSYQAPGTVMHETNHAIGGGTTAIWYGPSCMRTGSTTGYWLGERANAVLRFWDNDNSARVNGDATHFWPYGINGAHEDLGTEALYTIQPLINQALCEDGMQPVSGHFCLPAYSLEYQEGTKYYLTSESEQRGRGTAYLTEGASGKVTWAEHTPDGLRADDACAWYIDFDPSVQYYTFRNASTGHLLTYSSGFKALQRSSVTAADRFHVMRSRQDAVVGEGVTQLTSRGYWLIRSTDNSQPQALAANAGGSVGTATFSLENTAVAQRWLVLTADEAERAEAAATGVRQGELEMLAGQLQQLYDVPHHATADSVDVLFAAVIDRIRQSAAANVGADSTLTLKAEAEAACWAFLPEVTPAEVAHPFDITFLVPGYELTGTAGWTVEDGTPSFSYGLCEFYETKFKFTQTLKVPAGTYELRLQAFQRPGSPSAVWQQYQSGDSATTVNLFMRTSHVKVAHIAGGAQPQRLGGSESSVGSPVCYIPNDMQSASRYFAAGLYDNGVLLTMKTKGSMQFGIRCTTATSSGYWAAFSNLRLYYYGTWTSDDVTALRPIATDDADVSPLQPSVVYDLTGRRVGTDLDTLPAGMYIVGGKKVLVR